MKRNDLKNDLRRKLIAFNKSLGSESSSLICEDGNWVSFDEFCGNTLKRLRLFNLSKFNRIRDKLLDHLAIDLIDLLDSDCCDIVSIGIIINTPDYKGILILVLRGQEIGVIQHDFPQCYSEVFDPPFETIRTHS